MIGDDRLACAKGEAGRRRKVITDAHHANDGRLPAHTGAHQKAFLCRNVLEHLAKLSLHALGCQADSLVQQLIETCTLKG
jgi:hypothetical protein